MSRWMPAFLSGALGALLTYVWISYSASETPPERSHVLERPMLVGAKAEHAYYMLPAGVTLYWDGDMPEGFSRYKAYFNGEGQRLVEREQRVPGAITPATLQPIYKEELLDLLKLMKLSAADISSIIAGAQFTDEDRQQVRAVLDASKGTDRR